MKVDVYINEQKMDTDASTKIAETKQVNDFFEIKDRQTSYTNTFKLPMTDRNKSILGAMGIIGNTSLVPYRVHKVSVYRDGIQTISNGIGYFKDTNTDFQLYVYHDNISLFDVLGNKSLADLNLAPLNHILNITSWLESFDRSDYTYAVADYGKLDSSNIEIDFQIPSLYVAYLWNKVFTESGFTWKYVGRGEQNDFNPFLSDEWNELAITIDEGFSENKGDINPVQKLEITRNKTSQLNGTTLNTLGNSIVVQELTGRVNEYIRFRTITDQDNIHVFSTSAQYNRSRIRIKEEGYYRIDISCIFNNIKTENVSLFIEKEGYDLYTIKDDISLGQSTITFTNRLFLNQGDEIFIKVTSLPKDNESFYSYDMNLKLFLDNSVVAVNFSSYLSKIKQKDFIKDILMHYGLMFRRKEETYEFISFEELLDPSAQYDNPEIVTSDLISVDWSKKFNKVTKDSSKIGKYAQNNLFRYRYDNPDDTFADSVIKIDDETLDNERTLVTRLYRAPDRSITNINSQPLSLCRLYEKETDEAGNIKKVKPRKGAPYFFRVQKRTETIQYKISDADGVNQFSGNIPFMTFEGLDFNNIIATRYTAFTNMLNYGKKYTANLYLNVIDVHVMDFFKLPYIKQLGGIFYANKILSFTGNKTTKVEIIQVRSIEKLGQFSDDFSDDFKT